MTVLISYIGEPTTSVQKDLNSVFGSLHQRNAHVLGIRRQQILVVAGTFFPAAHDFFEIDLPGPDVFRG